MGKITSTKPSLTVDDIQAACAAALAASPPSPIASIQRGIITYTETNIVAGRSVTISSVDMSKTFVNFPSSVYAELVTGSIRIYLLNATTLVVEKHSSGNLGGVNVGYEVIEFA